MRAGRQSRVPQCQAWRGQVFDEKGNTHLGHHRGLYRLYQHLRRVVVQAVRFVSGVSGNGTKEKEGEGTTGEGETTRVYLCGAV